jgi:hypothetical protein
MELGERRLVVETGYSGVQEVERQLHVEDFLAV